MSYQITAVDAFSDEIYHAFCRLTPQLAQIPNPTPEHLKALIDSASATLFVARWVETGEIVGTATLATYLIPTDRRAWIEDVIVDSSQRGRGLGRLLMQALEDHAVQQGLRWLNLSSNPARVAANQLYRKLGYAERETNVYRKDLDD